MKIETNECAQRFFFSKEVRRLGFYFTCLNIRNKLQKREIEYLKFRISDLLPNDKRVVLNCFQLNRWQNSRARLKFIKVHYKQKFYLSKKM